MGARAPEVADGVPRRGWPTHHCSAWLYGPSAASWRVARNHAPSSDRPTQALNRWCSIGVSFLMSGALAGCRDAPHGALVGGADAGARARRQRIWRSGWSRSAASAPRRAPRGLLHRSLLAPSARCAARSDSAAARSARLLPVEALALTARRPSRCCSARRALLWARCSSTRARATFAWRAGAHLRSFGGRRPLRWRAISWSMVARRAASPACPRCTLQAPMA